VDVVDAAPDYFARIWRYQVTRSRRDFPAVRPPEPDRRQRRPRALSQGRPGRQERAQASLGQWQEERDVGTVLLIEKAIFPDKQYESVGRPESADIPIDYKLLQRAINPAAPDCAAFQRQSANSTHRAAFYSK